MLSRPLLDERPQGLPVVRSFQVEPDPRRVTCLDRTWRFAPGDVPGAEAPAFDDSGWATIDLPHTWNNHDELQPGANRIEVRGTRGEDAYSDEVNVSTSSDLHGLHK